MRWEGFLPGGDTDKLADLGLRVFVSRFGRGDGDRERLVDMVETEFEEVDRILFEGPRTSRSSLCLSLFRPLSCSNFASCSSATPFLRITNQVSGLE